MEPKKTAYLLLGSNLGDRHRNLVNAIDSLKTNCGQLSAQSAIYLSKAWGIEHQPDFYNQIVVIETWMTAHDLLRNILDIEMEIGRRPEVKWGVRIIDIDIIFYADEVIETPNLTVPHPRIAERNFTLVPLMELSPGMMHPSLGVTIEELYLRTTDSLDVIMIEN